MILQTTSNLKKYIAIGESFVFDDFQPYINKAVLKFTKRYVGDLHTELQNVATGTNASIKNEAREHLRNALANFSWFLYMPLAQLQIDSAGITIATNENRKSAEWWHIKDLRRELLQSGHDAMDELLKVLEGNPTIFTDYTSNYSTINNELIVNNATLFSKYYFINESRQTYLALQPTIRLVEDQYIKTSFCPELFLALKTNATGKLKEVQEIVQKAIVSFTVAKVAHIGLFVLDDKGLRIDFENFIDGRRENPISGKSVDQLEKLATDLLNNGTNYMKQAKEIIEANILDFNQCADPLLKANQFTGNSFTYDTKGIFGL